MTLGERLRALRESRGQTQDEVGAAVGRTGKAVWAWENDLNAPRMGVIELLVQHFNVTKSYLMGEDDDTPAPLPSNVRQISALHHQRVPMIGSVAAGEPIYDPEELGVYVEAPVDADAAITIRGDSMIPTYQDGDVVYIKCRPDVPEGAVAVVFLDNEATLKHVYKRRTGLTLISDNPAHPPIMAEFEDYDGKITIFGVPVGYTRIFKPDPLKKIKKGF
jgi:repressor LexA